MRLRISIPLACALMAAIFPMNCEIGGNAGIGSNNPRISPNTKSCWLVVSNASQSCINLWKLWLPYYAPAPYLLPHIPICDILGFCVSIEIWGGKKHRYLKTSLRVLEGSGPYVSLGLGGWFRWDSLGFLLSADILDKKAFLYSPLKEVSISQVSIPCPAINLRLESPLFSNERDIRV